MRYGRVSPILTAGLLLASLAPTGAAEFFRVDPNIAAMSPGAGTNAPASTTNNDPSTGLSVSVPCSGCVTRVQKGYSIQPTANQATSGWSIQSGQLPPGLGLDSNTGLISGTPTAVGSYSFVLLVAQPNGSPLRVPPVTVSIKALPSLAYLSSSGAGGRTVNLQPGLANAIGGGRYGITSGTLPSGITLDAASGVISGIAQSSAGAIKVTYTDGDGAQGTSNAFDILTTSSPVLSYPGSSYTGRVGASFAPVTPTRNDLASAPNIRVSAGILPSGLHVDPTSGVISGTPSVSGAYPGVSFSASAANGSTVTSNALSFNVGQPSVTYQGLSGQVGKPLTLSPQVAYLDSPQFSLDTGTLPGNVALSQSTGTISGTPNAPGTFTLTVLGYDQSLVQAVSPSFTLSIAPALASASTSATSVTEGSPVTFSATSGLTDPTWSASGNPAWMTFALSNGAYGTSSVSADVTAAQTYPVVLTATDASGATTSSNVSVQVTPATVTVANATVRSGATFRSAVTETMDAAGAWSATASPSDVAGLAVSGSNLTGTAPANAGTSASTRTLTATYTAGAAPSSGAAAAASGQGTLTVQPALGVGTQGAQAYYTNSTVNLAAPSVTGKVGTLSWALYSGSTNVTTTLSQTCAGLSFNATSGAVTGTPTAACSPSLSYVVTDAGDGAQVPSSSATSQAFALTVTTPVVSLSTSRVDIQEGQTVAFTATTTVPNPTWSLGGSPLPPWLTMTSSGNTATVSSVSGDVTQQTYYYPTLQATGGGTSASAQVTVYETAATSTVGTPANVHGGKPFTATATTTMTSPGSWSLSASAADVTNMSVSGTTLTGTAPANATAGTITRTLYASYVASAAPSSGTAATAPAANVTLTVFPAPVVNVSKTITANTRTTVSMTKPTANYVIGTATWSTPSTLPSGLSVDSSTGNIVGQTTQAGTYQVTFVATDTDGTSGSATSTLTVNSNDPVLSFADSPSGSTMNGNAWSNGMTLTMPGPVTTALYQNYGFWMKNNGPSDVTGLHFSVNGDSVDPGAFVYGNSGKSYAAVHEFSPTASDPGGGSNQCVSTLPVGKTCYVVIGFRPANNGQKLGTVAVTASNMAQPATFKISVAADKILQAGRMFVSASPNQQQVSLPVQKDALVRYMLTSGGVAGTQGNPPAGGNGPVVIVGNIYAATDGSMLAYVSKGQVPGSNTLPSSNLRTDYNATADNTAYAAYSGPYAKYGISGPGGRTDSTPAGMSTGYDGGSGTLGGGNYLRGYVSGGPYTQDLTGNSYPTPTFNQMTWTYGAGGKGGGPGIKCSGTDNYVLTGSGGGGGIVFDGNAVNAGAAKGTGAYPGTAGAGYGAGGGGGTLAAQSCGVAQSQGGAGGDGILYLEWDLQ